ncbi:MAG: DUF945 family protein [Halioglobus sp.]|nr:DUF945 family protein [Halioglobus sp.]
MLARHTDVPAPNAVWGLPLKRWLVACVLTLAALLLLSPGIVGLLAERAIERQIDFAESRDPRFAIAAISFERGWFTSAGQYRLPIVDPDLARLALALSGTAAEPGDEPALLIDTRLNHGLVPFGALSGDPASLLPVIASGVSTLHLQLAPHRIVDLPGQLVSRIGISGTAHFSYSLPAALFSATPELAERLRPLIAAGFLRRDGERYVLNAVYEKGLATINGAPIPLPLPGIQGSGT